MKYLILLLIASTCALAESQTFQLATFHADVTPPLGAPLCAGAVKPVASVDDPLSARGVVLLPPGQQPIVLCAVDWVGIGNEGWEAWKQALAEAAGTPVERVTVNCLHQHDAPFCDFDTEALLSEQNLSGTTFDVAFAREAISRTAQAVKASLEHRQPITQVGHGQAKVDRVASNRRVMGPDGKVQHVRWTATKDPAVRAREVGTIDPYVKLVSFWNQDHPVAVLSYYATHPQSHYGEGQVSADFVGMARSLREKDLPKTVHIHFNGAGGNISAGKWNDGSPENRAVLAERLAEGMRLAWEATEKVAVTTGVDWKSLPVSMPVRAEVSAEEERAALKDSQQAIGRRTAAAMELAWLGRAEAGEETVLSRLRMGEVEILFMPGELFVEYQLAAQAMKPGAFVAMAAYGDYGPGYIGTCAAYPQGGYETQLRVSRTAPEVESVLMEGMRRLLEE